MSQLLNTTGFGFAAGERRILSLRGPVWCAGPSAPPAAALWVLVARVKVSPESALQAVARLHPAGSAVVNKRPAVERGAGWIAWHSHGPCCRDLGLFPAPGEG